MKHFFILGSNPALSVAEIVALYPNNETGEYLQPDIFLLDTDLNAKDLIKRLGGTIKIGSVVKSVPKNKINEVEKAMLEMAEEKAAKAGGKFNFGISCHGKCGVSARNIGLNIKKYLKESGLSARFVVSREKTLSSVVVEQNKLLENGLEIILMLYKNEILIGRTEAVQDFKGLSYRDFGRPARDDESGMIPPKLAQIMLNLSGKIGAEKVSKKIVFLDPFCGSGTILMEVALLGIKNIIGSDISERAIEDTERNMGWAEDRLRLEAYDLQIFQASVLDILKSVKAGSIDLIVTEPYLGPQKGLPDADKVASELNGLYSESLKRFSKILKKDGVIVMIWPVLMRHGQKIFLSPDINSFKIKNPLEGVFGLGTTPRKTLIYGREGQKVWREIVILEKK